MQREQTGMQDFLEDMKALTFHHYRNSAAYRKLIDSRGGLPVFHSMSDVPLVMVSLFKRLVLKSIPDSDVYKVLTSSGTTGQQLSRVFLDTVTAQAQAKALVAIMQSYIGKSRRPMVMIDDSSHRSNCRGYNARAAGIQGLAIFGRDHFYALDDQMNLKLDEFTAYCRKYAGESILFFGFTFMVWSSLLQQMKEQGIRLDLKGSVLVHSGGWKKMQDKAVDNQAFKQAVKDRLGITQVHNFYGMAEQTGSVYVECPEGVLHESGYGKILIRKPSSQSPSQWSLADVNEVGVIQVLSTLPTSYPGHSILTEDRGVLLGMDDCPCGRKGAYFNVLGRVPKAEIRGCSDV